MKQNALRSVSVLPLVAAASGAFAAVDVTAITGMMGDIATIGGAVLAFILTVAGWKLLRRAA
jgi:hypothetical protein